MVAFSQAMAELNGQCFLKQSSQFPYSYKCNIVIHYNKWVDPWGPYHFSGKNLKNFFFRSICRYGLENIFWWKKFGPFLLKISSSRSFIGNMFSHIVIYSENIRKNGTVSKNNFLGSFLRWRRCKHSRSEKNDEKICLPYRKCRIFGHILGI